MLSYLVRIVASYERSHGIRPTLLYLNHEHLTALRANLAQLRTDEAISQVLGMEIIVSDETIHPQVAAHGHYKAAIGY